MSSYKERKMKMRNARKEWKIKYAKEWKIEYAKTSRSSCRTCRKFIKKEVLELGKVIPATKYDGVMTKWNHTQCILKRPNKISSLDDVEGIDSLRWEDQKRMRRYVQTGIFFNTTTVGVNECSIEVSQTCRAICKLCNKKITEGEIRISTKPGGEGTSTLAWHHAYCYMEWSHSTNVENLSGWNSLTLASQGDVHAYANKGTSTGNRDLLVELQGDKELPQKPLKGGVKRKRSVSRTEKSKINKSEWGTSYQAAYESYTSPEIQIQNSSVLESELEAQNKALWAIKNNLKEQVTIAEMRKMLEANDQHSAGSELDLREICADGMLFGPLGSCPICSGSLHYFGAAYRCHGYVSEWTKCSYSTSEPIRLKREWRIPQETSNEYLCKLFNSQKGCRSVRILPTDFSNQASGSQSAFKGLKVAFIGVSEDSMDYGISKQVLKIKEPQLPSSPLAQPVQNLMKMLFNVETYRSAMIELEIDMSEMPLGKLSKSNIQMGFSALTDIQNLLVSNNQDLSVRESLLIDASNRFFSIIPSTHPHVIRGARDLRPKEWTLELEDVFALDREGEFDTFAPYREKLQNKMLLWHGSRLTNFVGILSHGLRIAPPEVPSSGYMFGKGIYFADLVSKSAQYCRTSNWNPVGLLLLSEVALGDIYELKESMNMDRPPEGKNSTKGLGKKTPQKSEYMTWKNYVVVPCGKPVTSNARTSELMYNEYIVYDTAQVKMQFLVKVRFHHKR
ncbi:hypothetical protein C5167_004914 [Papaver somniferum]|uniref:Poly [ADP-ribose] polymerase n=1 Tax=Papaver somniferum TaxID=3469 RepID=A0A4Y7JC74_PAPSO|nr:hypothetical protein C5167_004914 [Papaver somniferum]